MLFFEKLLKASMSRVLHGTMYCQHLTSIPQLFLIHWCFLSLHNLNFFFPQHHHVTISLTAPNLSRSVWGVKNMTEVALALCLFRDYDQCTERNRALNKLTSTPTAKQKHRLSKGGALLNGVLCWSVSVCVFVQSTTTPHTLQLALSANGPHSPSSSISRHLFSQ